MDIPQTAILTYSVTTGKSMTSEDWSEVASLFSSEYGFYSKSSPNRPGQRIRLGTPYYERCYSGAEYRVARCRDGARLVAQAIYLEKTTSRGKAALVVQLVVAADYRCRGIASTLLHAIWGFSDYCVWGIVTSNAFTVEALERAVFRKASPTVIAAEYAFIREEVLSAVGFLAEAEVEVSGMRSVVRSDFYTDRSVRTEATEQLEARLGVLAEGEEWLAVVFREQEPDDFTSYLSMISASSDFVRDAYRRMPQSNQPWAAKTRDEIDVILASVPELPKNAEIVDFGAGSGRHAAELRRRGFTSVTAIDFAADSEDVIAADCRTWRSPRPVELALCLYDVVGSFYEDAENEAIIANLAANLAEGGYAVVSVSNWNFMEKVKSAETDFDNPEKAVADLFRLKPSTAMYTDGEFFRGDCVLVDPKRRIVCHKEQFPASSGALPGEYPVRDRRFTAEEISDWMERAGLKVLSTRFVRAGFKVDYAVSTGKEILVFAVKRHAEAFVK